MSDAQPIDKIDVETSVTTVDTTVIKNQQVIQKELSPKIETKIDVTKPAEEVTTKRVVETEPQYKSETSKFYPTENERILLCNLVGREYGSDFVPAEEKARVVSIVMNRVNSDRFPNNIWDVIHQSGQFEDAYTSCWDLSDTQYSYQVTQSVIDAVNYYFNNLQAFDNTLFFYYGDGTKNYFY